MIWVIEKLILHHFIDMGYEKVKIPIRVEVEYGLDGFRVTSISKKTLYNLPCLIKRYPKLSKVRLKNAIEETVENGLSEHFKARGYTVRVFNQKEKEIR